MNVTADACSDPAIMVVAVKAANDLVPKCKTALVIVTSACKVDGHGNHVTVAVVNQTGNIDPREAGAICRRLRALADELEQRFGTDGSAN